MTRKTSYQTGHPSRESHAKDVRTMTLCSQLFECFDHCKVDEHEEEVIDNEILNYFVLRHRLSDGPILDYLTGSKLENLLEDNTDTAIKVATRRLVTGIMEEINEYVFTVGQDEEKGGIKIQNRNMVEGALIYIV